MYKYGPVTGPKGRGIIQTKNTEKAELAALEATARAERDRKKSETRQGLLALVAGAKAKLAAAHSQPIVDVLKADEIKGLILSLEPTLPPKVNSKPELAAYYEHKLAVLSGNLAAIESS